MERIINILDIKSNTKTYLIDFSILLFIYFAPALSHLLAFPVYYLDPMRIAMVFGLISTSKKNTFLLVSTLPLFSFLISSHPQFLKSFLLSAELIINLSLFFWLSKNLDKIFVSFLLSVIISKIIYYLIKFLIINLSLLDDKLFSTPFYLQIIVAVILSIIVLWKFNPNAEEIKRGN